MDSFRRILKCRSEWGFLDFNGINVLQCNRSRIELFYKLYWQTGRFQNVGYSVRCIKDAE